MSERTIASHRETTSSRTPGRVNRGTVYYAPAVLRVCEDCGAITSEAVMPDEHAPHLARVEGRIALVNCRGVVLA